MAGLAGAAVECGPTLGGRSSRRVAFAAAAMALIALQVALALTHSPWEDETQAWNLAAFSPSWSAMLANLRYEGHPALWYALLRLVSGVSPALLSLAVLQAMVASASLAVLLARAPFPGRHRLALAASYLLLFEYGTMARSYGLGVLLLMVFLTLRTRPLAWLCLALMANVSLHFALLSGACAAALILVERRVSPLGLLVWIAGLGVALLCMWPAPDVATAIELPASPLARIKIVMAGLDALLIPADPLHFPMGWRVMPATAGGLLGCAALVIARFALAPDRRLLAIGGGLLVAVAGFSLLVYPASPRHVGVLFLFVLAADWIRADLTGEAPTAASQGWALVAAAMGLAMAASALTVPFTNSEAIARWARQQGLAGAVWATMPVHKGSALAANLDAPVYDLTQRCLTRFTRWNPAILGIRDRRDLTERLRQAASASGGLLMLAAGPGQAPSEGDGITRLATFPGGLIGEEAAVFAIRAPAAGGRLPVCPWIGG